MISGVLKPGEKREFSIMIFVFDNKDKNLLDEIQAKIENIRKIDVKKELQNTKSYWKKYVKSHIRQDIIEDTNYKKRINNIYKRTILLYPLLTNQVTGGVSAAMEIDEDFTKCRKILILLAKRFCIYYKGTRFA